MNPEDTSQLKVKLIVEILIIFANLVIPYNLSHSHSVSNSDTVKISIKRESSFFEVT